MENIKNYIIHLLGGVTKEELKNIEGERWLRGAIDMAVVTHDFAKKLDGMSADVWCKRMWEFLDRIVSNFTIEDDGEEDKSE